MKKIIRNIYSVILCFALIFSFNTAVFADNSSVTVSLGGEKVCLTSGSDYSVVLSVSYAAIGGVQGSVSFDTTNFDFQNVTVPNSIAKVNRLTKNNNDIITNKDIVIANENDGVIDFVILSDKVSTKLLTLNFKVSENVTNINESSFTLKNIKVSQNGGAKRIETVDITNITVSSHNYGVWKITKQPTLYKTGEKSRSCSDCGATETAEVSKLSPSAPKLKFKGATRIVLLKESNMQYSIDGVNWQSNNIFVGLSADTNYNVYSRLVNPSTNEISGISDALTVATVDIDCLVGEIKAERLSEIRKILLNGEKIAWADVNGDSVTDVRDVIRIKKVSAGYYDSYKKGDFKEDNVVDKSDAVILFDYLNGNSETVRSYLGDVNGDNVLDINDFYIINN